MNTCIKRIIKKIAQLQSKISRSGSRDSAVYEVAVMKIRDYLFSERFSDAELLLRHMLLVEMHEPELWELLGDCLKYSNVEEAITCYSRAIEIEPNFLSSYHSLGLMNISLNRLPDALIMLERASTIDPNNISVLVNLAETLRLLKRLEQASAIYRKAIALKTDDPELFYAQAICLSDLNNFKEAEAAFQKALELDSKNEAVYFELGTMYQISKEYSEAKEMFSQLIKLNPKNPDGYLGLAGVQLTEGLFQQSYETQTLGINSCDFVTADIHRQMIHICANLYGKDDEVAYHLKKVEELAPDTSHINDAVQYMREQKFAEALTVLDSFKQQNLSVHLAELNKSLTLLLLGFYKEGWQAYEARKLEKLVSDNVLSVSRIIPLPFWDGTPVLDKTLVVVIEQGIGDTIHFVRYLTILKNYVGKIILACNPNLASLFICIPDISIVTCTIEEVINADYQVLLLSLPMILKTEVSTIPNQIPYLFADNHLADQWRSRLKPWEDTFKVGLVWAGGVVFKGDLNRSIKLSQFSSIFKLENITFFSLQLGPQSAQISEKPPGAELIDFTQYITNFADTAAYLSQLDLVISVDTAAAHLAGAIGMPVWILLPFFPDHRWFLEREDSPWYPTARLFRQSKSRRWDDVFDKIEKTLSLAVSAEPHDKKLHLAAPKRDLAGEAELQLQYGREAYKSESYEEARSFFEQAVVLKSDSVNAWYNLGLANQALERHFVARSCYQRVLALNPSDAGVYFNIGCIEANQRNFAAAIENFRQSWQFDSSNPKTAYNYSHLLWNVLELDQALIVQTQGLKLDPTDKLAWANYALILAEMGKGSEANIAIEKAEECHLDDDENAWMEYATMLFSLRHYDMAISAFRHVMSLNPDNSYAYLYQSFIYLKQGLWSEGWALFEYRLTTPSFEKVSYSGAVWDGSEMPNSVLLVHSEQGLGDVIQCMRYLPLLKPKFKHIVLHIPETIAPLINMIPGVSNWTVESGIVPEHDVRISAMSLPMIFKTRLDNVPGDIPYIVVPEIYFPKWKTLAEMRHKKKRVGLAWAGSKNHHNDIRRSIGFDVLQPLLSIKKIQFWSLQKHSSQAVGENLRDGAHWVDKMHLSANMADTAALIIQLDLVITVDTAIAHLAGALGKPVWILLPYNADYRWLESRSDSPWYPTAKLFRQDDQHQWPAVIDQIKHELSVFIN
ncbi:MAG: tetratricopeptide repeat protein [Methylophilaceae bacterium]|nr:tetratricopeptide repeat protein [Methyloradius sp.]